MPSPARPTSLARRRRSQDAARELLARGAAPSDELHVACGEVSILPATIGAILKPRPPLSKWRDSTNNVT
jgi:hypothetical protein